MSEDRLPSIFAFILHADIAGSTALVQEDEHLAHKRIQDTFRHFGDTIIKYHGHVRELRGDALLAEFDRASDAVTAALAFQANQPGYVAQFNDNILPRVRVGIAMGEVIIADGTITGAGVVLAQRLEQLAEPGRVVVQSAVSEAVPTRLPFDFESLGEQMLKGFDKSVRALVVSLKAGNQVPEPQLGIEKPRVSSDSKANNPDRPELLEKPSIAVLPFNNMSDDPEQEYFADGIAEELITSLGRCRWLLVIARNSTFAYKGTSTDIRQISDELGVRYILEGSVRKSGSRVRVTTQLIDGQDGSQIWGERYDRQLDDVLTLQDEIASVIGGTIKPELETIEGLKLRNRSTMDLNAWDCYQRGLWHLYRFTTEELETARVLFERAIDLDPNFSQAYARLAYVLIQFSWYGPKTDRIGRVNEAARIAKQAVELDRRDPAARLSLGRALTLSGEFHKGIEELQVAVELDSNYAQAHFALGQALCSLDRHAEALREIDTSILLSPRDPHMWTFFQVRTIANYIGGDLEQAEVDALAALRQPNVTFYPYTILVPVLGRLGKKQAALDAIQELRRLRPGFSCQEAIDEWYFGERPVMTQDFMDQFLADLRNAGLPE
jgi:TolB-like protein/class 3 adenylate cyclase/Tfp pilus assembly protein PilF